MHSYAFEIPVVYGIFINFLFYKFGNFSIENYVLQDY